MGRTFMFNGDRFGSDEDFYRAYLAGGGKRLSSDQVNHFVRECFAKMMRDYDNSDCYENFPTLAEGFRRYTEAPVEELPLLEDVFAQHEFGTVSESHAAFLRRLRYSHRLGLVSNIWSSKRRCLVEFKRVGIDSVFDHQIFSSDFRAIKPSLFLFKEAVRHLSARPEETAFVGDDLLRDIEPAKRLGMTTVWISGKAQGHPSADFMLRDIQELEALLENSTS
jgi:HAD superfamily hydrolase (TIGR01509 family)